MRITDQDTGKDFFLDMTPELEADLAPLREACGHINKERRQRRTKNGAIQYAEQCLCCGRAASQALKHSDKLIAVPDWDENLQDRFFADERRKRDSIYQKHVRIQRKMDVGFWETYNNYLNSIEWLQKRAQVLKRANGQCEGCGEKAATQVHHTTYKHVFSEFLFELVAVCDACHARLHSDDPPSGDEILDSDLQTSRPT